MELGDQGVIMRIAGKKGAGISTQRARTSGGPTRAWGLAEKDLGGFECYVVDPFHLIGDLFKRDAGNLAATQ